MIEKHYDVAIIGGGLSGLSAAILLSKAGHSVVVLEKEKYPFHKVCGEYVSMESWSFLEALGVPLTKMDLPRIEHLVLTAPNAKSFTTKLPLGGFGISRHSLDHHLSQIATSSGVHILENTKVDDVKKANTFVVAFTSKEKGNGSVAAKVCCAAYGKRSNLDVKWKRSFHADQQLDNYVGIKYHVQAEWDANIIGLHNFENGYCGISKIEDEKFCLCYMTTAHNLKRCGNDIQRLEKEILCRNVHLATLFSTMSILKDFPVTISQINFNGKTQVENGVLMLGDAAGMITPLCGNGMSIALHTGKICAELVSKLFGGEITPQQLENRYAAEWRKNFARRLQTGRMVQKFFGRNMLSNLFVSTFKLLPFLAKPLIKMTHGKPF